jgi:Xaa-Pro aminopeptidase
MNKRNERPDEESPLKFSPKEFERRHRKIRELMQLRGFDCLVITGDSGGFGSAAADIRYVSGLPAAVHNDGPYIVFPLSGEPVGYVGNSFAAEWSRKTSPFPMKAVSFKRGTRIRDYPTDVLARIKELDLETGTIGIVTMRVMPAYAYVAIQKELPGANLLSAGDILLEARMVKSEEEMAFIRKSAGAADKGLEAIAAAARPGITEAELVAIGDAAMIEASSDRGNFILLGSGDWSTFEGTISGGTRRKLRKGDVIFMEITGNCQGYYTQLCCPIVLGRRVPDGLKKRDEIHRAMYSAARAALRAGNTVSTIDGKAAEAAARLGGDFRRAWALQTTELAESFFKLDVELRAGMCYVIHPWTEPRSGKGYNGHTIGDTCIVTAGDPEGVNNSLQEIRVV